MTTITDRLVLTRNRPAGFDWLRIGLAASIVGWHSIVTSYGWDVQGTYWASPAWRPPIAAILGMFFALSGFLVAGSLERCRTMVSFAGLRIIRIFPALVVEVLLSALILGPLLTHDTLRQYFADPHLWHYFANTLGIIHYVLPGVFTANPYPEIINAQLWTVPYELHCYEVLILISALGLYRRKTFLILTLVAFAAFLLSRECFANCGPRLALQGRELVFCFLLGVALFRFRDRVAWSGWLGALSAAAAVAFMLLPGGDSLVPIPLAYLTVYLGLLNPPRVKLLFSGDYSYGLYLYGFPIQQAIASTGPWARHWYVSLAVAFPLTVAVAAASWWFIEKPVLRHKAALLWLEGKFLAASGAVRSRLRQPRGLITENRTS